MFSLNSPKKLIVTLFITLLFPLSVLAQNSTLLPNKIVKEIIQEVSGEKAWWNINYLAQYHRIQPSTGYDQAALYVEKMANKYGLQDVHIEKFTADGKTTNFTFRTMPAWDGEIGELWMVEPMKEKIIDFNEIKVSLANYSRDADVTAELVDVNSGERDSDYDDLDVKGKIVLAYGNVGTVYQKAAYDRGALGVLTYYTIDFQNTRQPGDFPDQVTTGRIPFESKDGQKSTFAFMLSYRKGMMLKRLLEQRKVVVRAKVKAKVYSGYYGVVSGMIPGSKYPDQELVFIAHLDHYQPGANDNASGSVVLLEIARSINQMVANKIIEPPKRSIRFLWVPEMNGTIPYLAHHTADYNRMYAVINMDMVGANLKKTEAIFHLYRTPYSLPSFLNEVTQNFTEYARDMDRERFPGDNTYTIVSSTGSRDRFDVGIEKYSGGSDHYIFIDGAIKIPAVMFGTWPDVYYHTNEDVPDNTDPTTLKRVSFIGAASAIYMSSIGARNVHELVMETSGNAKSRLGMDEKKASQQLIKNGTEGIHANYKEAQNIIHQAYLREKDAVLSCMFFAEGNKEAMNFTKAVADEISKNEDNSQKRLKEEYQYLCKQSGIKPVTIKISAEEKRLNGIIPKRNKQLAGPLGRGYLQTKLKNFNERDLLINKNSSTDIPSFSNVPYEVLNFVDGKRSITEIRNAVSAEYVPVSLQAVEEYLNVLEKAEVIYY